MTAAAQGSSVVLSQVLTGVEHGGPDGLGVPRFDFSTNANSAGPCESALAAIQRADRTHYSDPSLSELREAIADLHGVAPQRVVPAASASEFITRITVAHALTGGQGVQVPPAAYGDYARAARAAGLVVSKLDAPAVTCADSTQRSLRWQCCPATPDGALIEPTAGLDAAICTVVDLAYWPLRLDRPDATLTEASTRFGAFWQLWTPNKALGLTGVRGAYAIAPSSGCALQNKLETLCPSWPLGADGVALLAAWCEPTTHVWLAGSKARLFSWRRDQHAALVQRGWRAHPGVTPFALWQPPAGWLLAHHAARLRSHGVKLRDATSFGWPGRVRLSVQPPAAQQALVRALDQINHPLGNGAEGA